MPMPLALRPVTHSVVCMHLSWSLRKSQHRGLRAVYGSRLTGVEHLIIACTSAAAAARTVSPRITHHREYYRTKEQTRVAEHRRIDSNRESRERVSGIRTCCNKHERPQNASDDGKSNINSPTHANGIAQLYIRFLDCDFSMRRRDLPSSLRLSLSSFPRTTSARTRAYRSIKQTYVSRNADLVTSGRVPLRRVA